MGGLTIGATGPLLPVGTGTAGDWTGTLGATGPAVVPGTGWVSGTGAG